jgi:hypothetical protein
MCNSLADGGLRCLSHVQDDIQKLTTSYHKGLAEALETSDVPKDSTFIAKKMKEYEKENSALSPSGLTAQELKEKLLEAHGKAMASKQALAQGGPDKFVSIADDLSDVKDSLSNFTNRESHKALQKLAAERLEKFNNQPEFATFEDKEELVNTVHLLGKYQEEIGAAQTLLFKKVKAANEAKENELAATNPMLRKLRQKAKISGFFGTENSYSNEKTYDAALKEEKERVGFIPASKSDFTHEQAKLENLTQERARLKGKLERMRKDYIKNAEKLVSANKLRSAYSATRVAEDIASHPTKASFQDLVHNENLYEFNRLKEQYTNASVKAQNPEEAKESYRAKVVAEAPYDKKAVEKFKTEVYNKQPKTQKILTSLEEKTQQKYISAGYRRNLQDEILSNKRDIGDIKEIARLEALKKKYDTLAEIEIGKNRLKSIEQNGISQGIKDVIQAQKQSFPAHYRKNLSKTK